MAKITSTERVTIRCCHNAFVMLDVGSSICLSVHQDVCPPGRVHDARMLRLSPFFQIWPQKLGSCRLLGDSAYIYISNDFALIVTRKFPAKHDLPIKWLRNKREDCATSKDSVRQISVLTKRIQ